jgi:predicted AAA+ superfamily ATPase
MEDLIDLSNNLVSNTKTQFRRSLYYEIDWSNRLIGIKGARGTGKTTMLLQWLKEYPLPINQKAYLSLDDMFFTSNSLADTARHFYLNGGKVLVLDEVHKYAYWAKEIKNLYDQYPDLKIVFTGSSIIDINKQEGDLSRRALMHELNGLSYREFLEFKYNMHFKPIELANLLDKSFGLRSDFPQEFKPLAYFQEYLKSGFYPFFIEDNKGYHQRLRQMTRFIIEIDMAELKGFDIRHAKKMLQLLYVIAQQVPFKPNINSLAEKTGIHRNSINNYLYFLEEAKLLSLLQPSGFSTALLQKPEKIFLENTNLLYALSENEPSSGTVREVFFNNQLRTRFHVSHSPKTDFEVASKYSFEIGGKNKGEKQISELANSYVVKDNIEFPVGNSIPLWLFGFLY